MQSGKVRAQGLKGSPGCSGGTAPTHLVLDKESWHSVADVRSEMPQRFNWRQSTMKDDFTSLVGELSGSVPSSMRANCSPQVTKAS